MGTERTLSMCHSIGAATTDLPWARHLARVKVASTTPVFITDVVRQLVVVRVSSCGSVGCLVGSRRVFSLLESAARRRNVGIVACFSFCWCC